MPMPDFVGWNQEQQASQQRAAEVGNNLTNMQMRMQQMQRIQQEQQEMEQLKPILAQAGGDPRKAIQALLATGNPRAMEIAAKLHSLIPAQKIAEPYTLGPDQVRMGPNNQEVARGIVRPPKEQNSSNISRLMDEAGIGPDDPRRAEFLRNAMRKESETAKQISPTVVMPRPEPTPIVQTDDQGNTKLYDRSGNLLKDLGKTGKASGAVLKTKAAQIKQIKDLSEAVRELEVATKDGGLIDQSTGSGAGALVDTAARFVGKATPGALAVGKLKPIYDLVLKMIPRFEGPQSDKDTLAYKEASGQLADPSVPNAQKKAAGKEILRLMKARRGQFISKEFEGTEADTGAIPSVVDSLLEKYK